MLISGFDAFGALTTNPTEALVERLASSGTDIQSIILPTSFSRSWPHLRDQIISTQATSVVMFGYAASADGLRVERRALNSCRLSSTDNDGNHPTKVISPSGPSQLYSTVRDSFWQEVNAVGKRVSVSNNAGGYVCNYVYFRALQFAHSLDRRLPVLFVHTSVFPSDAGRFDQSVAAARALLKLVRI